MSTSSYTLPLETVLPKRVQECLDRSTMTDVTLVADGDSGALEAHQCVLNSSPVLRALFLGREQRAVARPVVRFAGFHRDSVVALLQFVYTGQIGRLLFRA